MANADARGQKTRARALPPPLSPPLSPAGKTQTRRRRHKQRKSSSSAALVLAREPTGVLFEELLNVLIFHRVTLEIRAISCLLFRKPREKPYTHASPLLSIAVGLADPSRLKVERERERALRTRHRRAVDGRGGSPRVTLVEEKSGGGGLKALRENVEESSLACTY